MTEKPAFLKYITLILPLIFLWAGLKFSRTHYPNDPEYIYLMNALCICDGQSVGHIDNPGTTLMQIGAATAEIMHLFTGHDKETTVEQALKNPDKFIDGIRMVIVVLNAIMLLLLGWVGFKKTKSTGIALLLQSCTFFSAYILETTWAKLSPEPLLFFITILYIIVLFSFYHEKNKDQWKFVIRFALVSGAGLATKATFLPLLILPLFVIPSVKKKLFYLAGVVPAFVLFTIPAIPEYDRMFYWFRDLISHSGIYGHGANEIIDTKTYIPNIRSIISFYPEIKLILLSGVIVLGIGYFSKKRTNIKKHDLLFVAGLLVTYITGVLLVAKHYGGNHYLMPVILLLGITLHVLLNTINQFLPTRWLNTLLVPGFVIFIIGFVVWNHPKKLIVANKEYKAASEEIDRANSLIELNYQQYIHINYYIYSLNKFTGLKFGTDFAKGKMYPHLKKLFPKTYFYELSSNTYFNWNLHTNLQDIIEANGKKILLLNAPSDSSQIAEIGKQGFPLKKVYNGNSQNIYVLDTLNYIPPKKSEMQQIGSTISFNAEELSADRKQFIGSNSEIFGPVNALTTETSHSGTHSIKLEKSNPFAVDYNLNNTKAGELYQVDVWRKSDTSSGYLVVSADDSNVFYHAQNEAIKFDENGWELLRIDIEITKETEGKNLKIYLWNPRRRVAFFDDLSIKKFKGITQ